MDELGGLGLGKQGKEETVSSLTGFLTGLACMLVWGCKMDFEIWFKAKMASWVNKGRRGSSAGFTGDLYVCRGRGLQLISCCSSRDETRGLYLD